MNLQNAPVKKNARKKFNIYKLKSNDICKRFSIQLRNRFQVVKVEEPTNKVEVEGKSDIMEEAYIKRAEVLEYKKKKNKPWLSQEAWALIDQRKAIKQNLVGVRSERLKQRWQKKYRMKDWVNKRRRTEEIAEAENASRQQHMKTLYTLTKVLSNERLRQYAAVKDKNGNILNDKGNITRRRLEHLNEVLERENSSNPVSVTEIELPERRNK